MRAKKTAPEKAQVGRGEIARFEKEQGIVDGNVHTALIRLPEYDYGEKSSEIITTYGTVTNIRTVVREGRLLTEARFNPSQCGGHCGSLNQYSSVLQRALSNMHFWGQYELSRIDFKIDCNPSYETWDYWVKLNDLLVYTFIACKGIKEQKERGREIDPLTGDHKETKASTRSYCITSYNKEIQKPGEGIGYRTEIRLRNLNNKAATGYTDEAAALKRAKNLILKLPAYYERAVEAQTQRLLAEYRRTSPSGGERRSIHEFLRAHQEDIFNREQLERFAKEAEGITVKQAQTIRKNFVARNPYIPFVAANDLLLLCAVVADLIDNYTQSPSFLFGRVAV